MVTWAALGQFAAGSIGLACAVVGLLMVFAAGMASAPTDESKQYSRKGCQTFLFGIALIVAVIWERFF
jgi:cell division protein FtsW (lipid II flippase)